MAKSKKETAANGAAKTKKPEQFAAKDQRRRNRGKSERSTITPINQPAAANSGKKNKARSAKTSGQGKELSGADAFSSKPVKGKDAENRKNVKKGSSRGKLRIMFFGGVGEIGKNMTAVEYNDDIIVVATVSFPTILILRKTAPRSGRCF